MAKRKLKRSKVWTDVQHLAFQQKIRLRIEKHFQNQYIERAGSGVVKSKYTQKFSKQSEKLRNAILEHSLESYATVDGGEKVNDVLQELGFRDGELNTRELERFAVIILRAQIFVELVTATSLPAVIKTKMIDRFIAQLLPTRDNIPKNDSGNTASDTNNLLRHLLDTQGNHDQTPN